MKRYFVYELKKSLFAICVLAIVMAAVYAVALVSEADYLRASPQNINLDLILAMGGIAAVVVPIWKLSYKMKKRSVDLYYSLPLSHRTILAVKLLVGLIAVFAPFTVAYWTGAFITMGIVKASYFVAMYYVPIFFASLPAMLAMYSIAAFLYTRGNTVLDGMVILLAASSALPMLATVLESIVWHAAEKYAIFPVYYQFYTPLALVEDSMSWRFINNISMTVKYSGAQLANMIVGLVLTGVAAVAAGWGLFFCEKRVKAENTQQISESLFGYKTLIPFYTFSAAYLVTADVLVVAVIVAAAAYAACVLYKRTSKIGRKTALIAAIAFIVGAILSFIVVMD